MDVDIRMVLLCLYRFLIYRDRFVSSDFVKRRVRDVLVQDTGDPFSRKREDFVSNQGAVVLVPRVFLREQPAVI